jgi:uncharacterized membrane protein
MASIFRQTIAYNYQQPKPQKGIGKLLDIVTDFLVEYWAHVVTILFGTLVLCAIAVPFLSYLGLDSISKPIFYALHLVCAQIPSHSFYILGHQLGMCARNFSIYTAMFIGSFIFILTKKRMPGIPWWVWILMMVPIAWDGLTQMVGWRESDWILRVVTGTLFGVGNVWFALPMMQKSLTETTPPQIPAALLKRHQNAGFVPTTYGISATPMIQVKPDTHLTNVLPQEHMEAKMTEPQPSITTSTHSEVANQEHAMEAE